MAKGNHQPSKGAKPDKLMRDAIMLALHRAAKGQKTKRLTVIADKLVELACEGDMQAIKEVNDRVDGKPVQGIVGDPDQPVTFIVATGISRD